jgi:hypothetical protein
VVTTDLRSRERLGHTHVGVADDGQVLLVWFERDECAVRHHLEVLTDDLRCEEVLRGTPLVAPGQPVDFLDRDEGRALLVGPGHRAAHPAGWNHRVHVRQGERGAHAAQEAASVEMLSRDELHRPVSPRRVGYFE